MVIMLVAAAAELEAVKVTKLEPAVGLEVNEALTPLGRPEAARVTEPLKGLTSVTEMVSVPLVPCAIDKVEADGASLKLPVEGAVTVKLMLVVALSEPEVPVMVIMLVAAAAELEAVKVTKLEPVVGLEVNAALTPLGRPEAARVTEPLKGLTSVTEMVSVPLVPCASDSEEAEGASEKLPGDTTPLQLVPLTANDVGIALVTLFHVPLKPTPERVAPAATLPL
jgi:hypothetical protein